EAGESVENHGQARLDVPQLMAQGVAQLLPVLGRLGSVQTQRVTETWRHPFLIPRASPVRVIDSQGGAAQDRKHAETADTRRRRPAGPRPGGGRRRHVRLLLLWAAHRTQASRPERRKLLAGNLTHS